MFSECDQKAKLKMPLNKTRLKIINLFHLERKRIDIHYLFSLMI